MNSIIQTQNATSLYDANSAWTSLTRNNLLDNVILAVALFLTSIFIRNTASLMLYNQMRCFTYPDQKPYWAVSRVLIMENMTRTWLPRGRSHKSSLPHGRYKERNYGQYVLSLSMGLFLLVLEIILIILAVPGKKEFIVPSNRVIHLEVKAPEKPVLARYPNSPCFFSDKINGVNLQSQGQWSICREFMISPPADSEIVPDGIGLYIVLLFEEHELVTRFRYLNLSDNMEFTYKVALNNTVEANVRFAGRDIPERVIDALETNLQMMENETNLIVLKRILSRPDPNDSAIGATLIMNISNTRLPSIHADSLSISPDAAAVTILHQATAAVFNTRKPGPDTPPLQVSDVFGNESWIDYNEPLTMGFYNGPLVTTLGSLILALVSLAIYVIAILIYRSPGHLAYEVVISHRRLYGDVLLSGPNTVLKWSSAMNRDGVSRSQDDSLADFNSECCVQNKGMVNGGL